jgi:hypothetical protein
MRHPCRGAQLVFGPVCLLIWFTNCSGCSPEAEKGSASDGGASEARTESGTTQEGSTPDSGVGGSRGCGTCHGTAEQPAPPPGVDGNPSAPGVGAHAPHMKPSSWRAEVRCKHCHVVPQDEDDDGHIDDARPADVHFSGLATVGSESQRLPGGACAVYCHGAAMRIEPKSSPAWSSHGMACGGCHRLPPPSPHPNDDGCSRCHLELVDKWGQIAIPSRHIDSVVNAPKGAHLVHLGGAGGPSLSCTECHDGTNYHGPLKDGHFLDETTICDDCHTAGTVDRSTWHADMMGHESLVREVLGRSAKTWLLFASDSPDGRGGGRLWLLVPDFSGVLTLGFRVTELTPGSSRPVPARRPILLPHARHRPRLHRGES